MRVYVCYLDYGCEGKGDPLHVFLNAAEASSWFEGAKDSCGTAGKVMAMEVIGSDNQSEGGSLE